MAKNSKKTNAPAANGIAPASTPKEAPSSAIRAKSARKSPALSTSKTAAAAKLAQARSRKEALRKAFAPVEPTISDDQIRLRAYFLAEYRMQNGLAGDSNHDWNEARRQLQEENRPHA